MIVGRKAARVIGIEGGDEAIEEFSAARGAIYEQAVHGGRQPDRAHVARQRRSPFCGVAADMNRAPLGARGRKAGSHVDGAIGRCQSYGNSPRHDGHVRARRLLAADLGKAHAPQTTPRREKRKSFEKIGFARAISPREHDRARIYIKPQGGVAAEIGQREARHAKAGTRRARSGRGRGDGGVAEYAHTRIGIRTYMAEASATSRITVGDAASAIVKRAASPSI